MQQKQTLLEFPCDFPIKVMGRSDSGFEVRALEIVRRHVPDFSAESMRSAASRQGNYLSYTFVIRATSREQRGRGNPRKPGESRYSSAGSPSTVARQRGCQECPMRSQAPPARTSSST